MKAVYNLLLITCLLAVGAAHAATYRNFVTATNPANKTLAIWINSDTVLGEGVIAQLRYNAGAGDQYVTFVDGAYDNAGQAGANWRVTFNNLDLPSGNYQIYIELANKNQSGTPYGYTGFANSVSRQNYQLPVALVSFNAKASGFMASLDWATASESGNGYFGVERSIDAQTFTQVGRVEGQGTTATRQNYTFTDESPSRGTNYYRLRQVDAGGQFTFSPVRAVLIRSNGELAILGNPATDQLGVAGLEASSTVDLLDLNGQLRSRQASTDSRLQIDVRDLPSGTYLLRVAEPTGTQTRRVLVVH